MNTPLPPAELKDPSIIQIVAKRLLQPVVVFLLRHGMRVQEITETIKLSLLEGAAVQIAKEGDEVTISRLSARTGLHRRDVVRLYREGRVRREPRSFLSRIIGQWQFDPAYQTKKGEPKLLEYEGNDSEFRNLVKGISSDIGPHAILSEMERSGIVTITPRGLKLNTEVYAPRSDQAAVYEMLGTDIGDLIEAVSQNAVTQDKSLLNLHAKTVFDNIDENNLPIIRKWLFKEGSRFHKKVRLFLARYDRDFVGLPYDPKSRVKVSLASFSRVSPFEAALGESPTQAAREK